MFAHCYERFYDGGGGFHSAWNNHRLAEETEMYVAVEYDGRRGAPQGQHLRLCVFNDKAHKGLVVLTSALPQESFTRGERASVENVREIEEQMHTLSVQSLFDVDKMCESAR